MKLCTYFGTFNPIHNGHLAIASYVRKCYEFDVILFVPAYKPPHKHIDDELAQHRFKMAKTAIEGENLYSISNIEYRHEKFSYTYLTICELYKLYPSIEGKISFVIGSDAFKKIQNWYESDKLKELVKFIVFPREKDFDPDSLNFLKFAGYEFEIAKLPFIDLASKVIRARVKKGKPITGLVPPKVIAYIKENELYQECKDNSNTTE